MTIKWQRIHDCELEAYECYVASEAMAERALAQFRPASQRPWQYDIDHCTDGRWRVQIYEAE